MEVKNDTILLFQIMIADSNLSSEEKDILYESLKILSVQENLKDNNNKWKCFGLCVGS